MERRRCVVAIGEGCGCGCASGGLRRCVGWMPHRHRDSWRWAGKYSRGFRHGRKRDRRQHRCHRRSLEYQWVERSNLLHILRTKSISPGSKPFQWQVWPTCDKQWEAEKLGQGSWQLLFEQSPAFSHPCHHLGWSHGSFSGRI